MRKYRNVKGLGKLGYLTGGERLWLRRRRRGQSQPEAARAAGIKTGTYKKFERDAAAGPLVVIHEIEPGERAAVHRRRSGLTQQAVARRLGVSRIWVNRMERGLEKADKLLSFWEK